MSFIDEGVHSPNATFSPCSVTPIDRTAATYGARDVHVGSEYGARLVHVGRIYCIHCRKTKEKSDGDWHLVEYS